MVSIGQRNKERDAKTLRVLINSAPIPIGVVDHGGLVGLLDDDHTMLVHMTAARTISAVHTFQPSAPGAPFLLGANAQGQLVTGLNADLLDGVSIGSIVQTTRQVIAGSGLTGGGALSADVTLNVGAGTLITVAADSVGMSNGSAQYQVPVTGATPFTPAWTLLSSFAGTAINFTSNVFNLEVPGTLSVSSTNQAIDAHTHDITTSSNPGAAASILATDASGIVGLVQLNVDTIIARSGGNLNISPAGDVVFDPTGNDLLPNTGYDLNIGMLTKKFLTIHAAELWVETLVAQNTLATIGGRILVGPTNVFTSDAAPAAGTINTKYNNMAINDIVYCEANGAVEFMRVTAGPTGTGPYQYDVVRNLDGSGANQWYAGDAIFNTGTTGDGYIDLYSVRGILAASHIGPTIQGNVRNSITYNDVSTSWAIGNLNGLYGYGTNIYGVGLGKYTTTTDYITIDPTNGIRMYSDNAQKVSITGGAFWLGASATAERLAFDTTNGLRIINHSNAAVIQFDISGNADITGKLRMPGASSAIAIGSTPPTSASVGTGIWLDRTGMYMLASSTLITKIDAATGKITTGNNKVRIDNTGIQMDAEVYPPTALLSWKATDDNSAAGAILGTYSGALTNSGLLIFGYAHDATVFGLINFSIYDESSNLKTTATIDGRGRMVMDFSLGTVDTTGSQALTLKSNIASGNVLNNLLYLDTNTKGTPAAGLGTSISFRAENSTGVMKEIGYIGMKYDSPTNGAEFSRFVIGLINNGSMFEIIPPDRYNLSPQSFQLLSGATFVQVNNATAIEFSDGATEVADNSIVLPTGWNGHDVTIAFFWSANGTSTGNVRWVFELRRLTDGTLVPSAATVSSVQLSAGPGVANQLVRVAFTMSLSGFIAGDGVAFRVYRDGANAADTLTNAADLFALSVRA